MPCKPPPNFRKPPTTCTYILEDVFLRPDATYKVYIGHRRKIIYARQRKQVATKNKYKN